MNKVILIGRLTRDPEMRTTTTGKNVCKFTLAVNRKFQKQGEESQADFLPVVAWEKTAEFCNNYFRKGQQVAVVGRMEARSWDDEQGVKKYITEIIAEEAHFADSKRSADTSQSDEFPPFPDDNDLPF